MKKIIFLLLLTIAIGYSSLQAQTLKSSDQWTTTSLMYSGTLDSTQIDSVARHHTDSTNTLYRIGNIGVYRQWYRPTIYSDSCLLVSPDATFPANNTARLVRGSVFWSWTAEKKDVGSISDWNNIYIKKESGLPGAVQYDFISEGR